MLLKILGSILVLTCGVYVGANARRKLAKKVDVISGIISVIDTIQSEISCMCTPTKELLKKISANNNAELNRVFHDIYTEYVSKNDVPLAIIWSRTIKNAEYLEMNSNESETFMDLGNILGRYSAEDQLRSFANVRNEFEKYLRLAEESKNRLGKLYGSLSIISGIALVIVLL